MLYGPYIHLSSAGVPHGLQYKRILPLHFNELTNNSENMLYSGIFIVIIMLTITFNNQTSAY